MKIQLSVRTEAGSHYKFSIDLVNNSAEALTIPLERMQRSASRVGLSISDGSNVLEPVAFDVVNYRKAPQLHTLPPHGSAEILMSAELRRAGASSYILVFDGATYQIGLGCAYEISFRMDEFESNVIRQIFEAAT